MSRKRPIPARDALKVRTFTGTDAAAIDQQISDWLAETGVRVRKTSTAFKRLRDKGKDVITGKTVTRRGVGVAISVWYDEPGAKKKRQNPANWVFEMKPARPAGSPGKM